MVKPDKELQKRVWQRVYGENRPQIDPNRRQELTRCRRRELENARNYGAMVNHSRYGEAFRHLKQQAEEHAAMLEQMLKN